jgi:uncharacterized protein
MSGAVTPTACSWRVRIAVPSESRPDPFQPGPGWSLTPMKQLTITIPHKSVTVGSQIGLADTSMTRLFGLLGKDGLDPGAGILIRPSSGVHTMGMRFAIDVIALDRDLRVVKLWPRLRPWRVTSVNLRTQSVLELGPGQIEQCGIEPGDQLVITENA